MRKNQKEAGKSRFIFLLFFPLLLLTIISKAQNRSIMGTVIDSQTSEPVSGASVIVKGSKNGVTTDATGRFSIHTAGNAVLLMEKTGER